MSHLCGQASLGQEGDGHGEHSVVGKVSFLKMGCPTLESPRLMA